MKPLIEYIMIKNITILVSLLLILMSCDGYVADYPVGESEKAVDYTELIGAWNAIDSEEDVEINDGNDVYIEYPNIRISKFNSHEFLLEIEPDQDLDSCMAIGKYLDNMHVMRGWINKIKTDYFLSISPIGIKFDETKFYTYNIEFKGDTLVSSVISAKFFETQNIEINSIKSHDKFIKSVLNKPEYWTVVNKYVKRKD